MEEIDVGDLKEGEPAKEYILFDDNFIALSKHRTLTGSDLERIRRFNLHPLYAASDMPSTVEEYGPGKEKKTEEVISREAPPRSTYDILISYLNAIFAACRQKKKVSLQTFHKAASLTVDYYLKAREEALLSVARGGKKQRLEAHSLNTGILSALLATAVNMEGKELVEVITGALLHDIGIMNFYDSRQVQNIEQHTLLGFKYLKETGVEASNIVMPALQHHEKANGSGYPSRLTLNDTAHSSRIVSICDSCDSQISYIRYGDDISLHLKKDDLFAWKKDDFDIRLFGVFISALSETFRVGRRVLLNNMTIGVIKRTTLRFPISPVIELVADTKGKAPREPTTIELVKHRDVYIERFLQG